MKEKLNAELLRLAARIAKDLFTGGMDYRAKRLVLERESNALPGAGWCEKAARDRIYERLASKFKLRPEGKR